MPLLPRVTRLSALAGHFHRNSQTFPVFSPCLVRFQHATQATATSSDSDHDLLSLDESNVPIKTFERSSFNFAPPPRNEVPAPWSLIPYNMEVLYAPNRFVQHLENNVHPDLLGLLYNHQDELRPPQTMVPKFIPRLSSRTYMLDYGRIWPRYPYNTPPKPPRARTSAFLPRISRIRIAAQNYDAAVDKTLILPLLASIELITGYPAQLWLATEDDRESGIREGIPKGASVDLYPGPKGVESYSYGDMLAFYEKLVELVLPKQKTFYGLLREGEDNDGRAIARSIAYRKNEEIEPAEKRARRHKGPKHKLIKPDLPSGTVRITVPADVALYFPEMECASGVFPELVPLEVDIYTTSYDYYEACTLLTAMQIPVESGHARHKRQMLSRGGHDSKDLEEKKIMERIAKRKAEILSFITKRKGGK